MKNYLNILVAVLFGFGLVVWSDGCAKKVVPPPATKAVEPVPPAPVTPPVPVPTISLSAQPSTIMKGQSTVLSWQSANATTVELDNGMGTVAASGQVTLAPSSSITYTAKASGAGGSAAASTRVTVEFPITPPTQPLLSDQEFLEKRIQDLFFDYDQFNLRDDQKAVADANVRALKERPNLKIMIEGHCDERGSEKFNLVLGDRRANAVKSYLVERGVSPDRMDTTSYGKERPFNLGHSEEAWAQNRRAHFLLKRQISLDAVTKEIWHGSSEAIERNYVRSKAFY
jgi:peptidoglycan-associated lipoprotein